MRVLDGEEVLLFLEGFQQACAEYKSAGLLPRCLSHVAAEKTGWLARVSDSLRPELMYEKQRGVAMIQVAELLAQTDEGGEWPRLLLEEGGRGNFGGTLEQIDRAAGTALFVSENGGSGLAYAESILDSVNVPNAAGIGQTLIHYLGSADGRCWPEGDSAAALNVAMRVLRDPRFSQEAAAQLLSEFGRALPKGWEERDWERLSAEARSILGR